MFHRHFATLLCLMVIFSSALASEPKVQMVPALGSEEIPVPVSELGTWDPQASLVPIMDTLSPGTLSADKGTRVAPIGLTDAYVMAAGDTLVVYAPAGLLKNDFDPDGDSVGVLSASTPPNGSFNGIFSNGQFAYIPDDGFLGQDSFTYRISDGSSNSDLIDVLINVVSASNLPPMGVTDSYLTEAGQVLTVDAAAGVLANDYDPDGDSLSVISFEQSSNGVVSMSADGSFTFTPNPGYTGTEALIYTLYDGQLTSSTLGTLVLQVVPGNNRPPVPVNDAYVTGEDQVLTINAESGVLANDYDPDGDTINAISFEQSDHGVISLSADGSFTFTPDTGWVGTESLNYSISDGQVVGETHGTLVLQVVADGNRAPVGGDDWWYTPQDALLTVPATSGLLANDMDPNGDSVHIVSFQQADNGVASLGSDGSFTYQPDDGFVGIDSIRYRLFDAHGIEADEFVDVTFLVGIYVEGVSAVENPPEAIEFALRSAVPNPFNPSTTISFNLEVAGPVALRVLDVKGQVVATLLTENRPAGQHSVVWNGQDATGRRAASGTYFAELRSNSQRAVRKLALIK